MENWSDGLAAFVSIGDDAGMKIFSNLQHGTALLILPALIAATGGRLLTIAATIALTAAAIAVLSTSVPMASLVATALWVLALVVAAAGLGRSGRKRVKSLEQEFQELRLRYNDLQTTYERELLSRLRSNRAGPAVEVPSRSTAGEG